MAVFLLDSSAIVKRYIAEVGSQWMLTLTDPAAGHDCHVVETTLVEVIAAIVRRRNGGDIAHTDAAVALSDFRQDWHSQYGVVLLNTSLIDRAALLAEQHGLRGYDALQLAAALNIAMRLSQINVRLTLVSADSELNTAAKASGLNVKDPNEQA